MLKRPDAQLLVLLANLADGVSGVYAVHPLASATGGCGVTSATGGGGVISSRGVCGDVLSNGGADVLMSVETGGGVESFGVAEVVSETSGLGDAGGGVDTGAAATWPAETVPTKSTVDINSKTIALTLFTSATP